jgi:hypothetical protein
MTRVLLPLLIAFVRLRATILYLLWPEHMIDTFYERFSKLTPKTREILLRRHGLDEKQLAKVIAHAHFDQANG